MTDHQITEAMIVYGGSFAEQLGRLFRAGDEINQRRLKRAFPELWKQYEEIAERRAKLGTSREVQP